MRTRDLVAVWIFVAVVVAAGCGEGGRVENATGTASPQDRAEPETFRATSVTEHGQRRQLVANTEIRLVFHGDTITASAGCNELTGRASMTGDKRLTVSDLVTTDKHCGKDLARQEAWLVAFLKAQPSWLRDRNELVLYTATAEVRLTI